ncbi:methyltransferase domain-containing protein [Mucilaginibacter mali]|uniref:Methyltransferase domain-containing protein n=1 Tax=Mucilaginibacter mali TaxID=2740462 RepID=A0A7D4UCY0_9SPHI|nr:methyltransferase domain-containing protein [Mucilaginibacter mali]QKJ29919.1 methyltransferase domain-containing protein [Mucilaginibacter mali]
MLQELKKYLPKGLQRTRIPETEAGPAYDIWSVNYDNQPGNLMLDLDEVVFRRLLSAIDIKDKRVADIGCGTGRHWQKMLQWQPAHITGFDVSAGMLNRLKEKFPQADTELVTNDSLLNIPTDNFDIIVSTLTVAHIKNLENSLLNWCRIVKNNGDILITDFHPQALDMGGQRTFKHNGSHIAVRNFVHQLASIKAIMSLKDWEVVSEQQIIIDETLKHYYESQNALHVYEKFKGMPIIYGLHFKQKA